MGRSASRVSGGGHSGSGTRRRSQARVTAALGLVTFREGTGVCEPVGRRQRSTTRKRPATATMFGRTRTSGLLTASPTCRTRRGEVERLTVFGENIKSKKYINIIMNKVILVQCDSQYSSAMSSRTPTGYSSYTATATRLYRISVFFGWLWLCSDRVWSSHF